MDPTTPPAPAANRKGLLLVPEFPSDTFWSYRHVVRLVGRKAVFPPLGLLTFAGYLPQEWELELVDLNVRRPSDRALRRKIAAADAVFTSAMSIQKRSLVDVLAGPAAGLDTPFILGGSFASSYRDEILEPRSPSDRILHDGLDVLVWGEAQGAVAELFAYLDTDPTHTTGKPLLIMPETVRTAPPGSRAYLNERSIFKGLDHVPIPRWDLLRVHDYLSMMIQTTAGCPFRCDFCDIVQFNGGFSRPKSREAVRAELQALLDTGYRGGVFTVDDNFIGAPDAISGILDVMTEFQRQNDYPFSFYTQASVNLGTPALQHLTEQMKAAGFQAVFLGIENPDPVALRSMNKKQNLKVDIPQAVAQIQAAGIEVYAGFIFGCDGDTPSTADGIVEFVKENKILTAMTGMLTPVPHTPLHARLQAEGRLRQAEFSGNNTDDEVQFEPSAMSADELQSGVHDILYRLFNPAEAYRRTVDMLGTVRSHIFARRRADVNEIKAALVSLWKQGLARLDRDYASMLWKAFRLDRQLYRATHREARLVRRLRRAQRREPAAAVHGSPEVQERLLALAYEYLVRFRPDRSLAEVRAWAEDVRGRLREGTRLGAEQARLLIEGAARNLRARMRMHRFPGVKFTAAMEAAIKAMHYQKVMVHIVAGAAAAPAMRARLPAR